MGQPPWHLAHGNGKVTNAAQKKSRNKPPHFQKVLLLRSTGKLTHAPLAYGLKACAFQSLVANDFVEEERNVFERALHRIKKCVHLTVHQEKG